MARGGEPWDGHQEEAAARRGPHLGGSRVAGRKPALHPAVCAPAYPAAFDVQQSIRSDIFGNEQSESERQAQAPELFEPENIGVIFPTRALFGFDCVDRLAEQRAGSNNTT